MININEKITDISVLERRYVVRDGFVFTKASPEPNHIYDSIVIKHPMDIVCDCPKIGSSVHDLDRHIALINEYKLEKALIISNDISFITKCPTLKYLSIVLPDSCMDKFDYSPLYDMPEIKSLHCDTVYGHKEKYSTTIDLSKIKGLEDTQIKNENYKNYNTLENLKTIGFTGYKDKDLSRAFSGAKLDTLLMIQCRIESLKGIEKANNLQCLYLYYNKFLKDISALADVKDSLRALQIEACSKITDFSVLSQLKKLEHLKLEGQNKVPNLNFVKDMKNLKTFIFTIDVEDGDISVCSNLSYVYCQNRRHYNLKDKDLPKGRYVRGNEDIDPWRSIFL